MCLYATEEIFRGMAKLAAYPGTTYLEVIVATEFFSNAHL